MTVDEELLNEVEYEDRDSPITVHGVDHITITGSNPEDTITFYRDILGMPLVMAQPNLDRTHLDHLFFDAGDGRLITFFVEEGRQTDSEEIEPDVGGVHHQAFRVDREDIDDIREELENRGFDVFEADRGAFHSLYTNDPNGLTIELAADEFGVPDTKRGQVLALAHQRRVEQGDGYVKPGHVEWAMDELGI